MAPVLVGWEEPVDVGEGAAEVTEGLAEADVEDGPDVEGAPVDVALEELDTEEEVMDDVVEAVDEEEGTTDDELASVVVLGWTVVEEGGGFDVVGLADVVGAGSDVVGAGSDVVGGFAEVVGAGSDVVGGSVVLDVGGLGWSCVVVGSGVVAGLLVTAGLLSEEEPDETAAALGPFPSLFDRLVCDVRMGWESEVVGVCVEDVMEVGW